MTLTVTRGTAAHATVRRGTAAFLTVGRYIGTLIDHLLLTETGDVLLTEAGDVLLMA